MATVGDERIHFRLCEVRLCYSTACVESSVELSSMSIAHVVACAYPTLSRAHITLTYVFSFALSTEAAHAWHDGCRRPSLRIVENLRRPYRLYPIWWRRIGPCVSVCCPAPHCVVVVAVWLHVSVVRARVRVCQMREPRCSSNTRNREEEIKY